MGTEKLEKLYSESNVECTTEYRPNNFFELTKKYSKVYIDVTEMRTEMITVLCIYLRYFEHISYTILPSIFPDQLSKYISNMTEDLIVYTGNEEKYYAQFKKLVEKACSDKCDLDTTLIGETGSGKTYFAEEIAKNCSRRAYPYYIISCARDQQIFESELFGHKKGAFTSASQDTKGVLEKAECGVVILDDVDCLSLYNQQILLDVLQRRKIHKMGETGEKDCNIRFIFTLKNDIIVKLEDGSFRKDLWSRISGLKIHVPSLNFRKGEIPNLIKPVLKKYQKQISDEALSKLLAHEWNSNIRFLKNRLEAVCILSDNDIIQADEINLNDDY